MKTLILTATIISIFCASFAHGSDICLTSETTGMIFAELQQCRLDKEELVLCKEDVRNLEQTVDTQEKEITTQKTAIETARETAAEYRRLFDKQGELFSKMSDIAAPSFFEQLKGKVTWGVVGAAAAIILKTVLGR